MSSIIRLTLKEVLSKRILHLGLVLTALYLGLFATGLHYLARDFAGTNQIIRLTASYQIMTMGLYISSFMSAALAILAGAGAVSREIETGTILAIAAKPISRGSILIGKFISYAVMAAVYAVFLALGILYLTHYYLAVPLQPGNVLPGLGVFALIPLTILGPCFLGGSLLSTMANGVTMFLIYSLGVIGGFLEQIGVFLNNQAMVNTGIVSSLMIPGDAAYRLAVSLVGGEMGRGVLAQFGPFGCASTPSTAMLIYALIYVAVTVSLAVWCFARRDL